MKGEEKNGFSYALHAYVQKVADSWSSSWSSKRLAKNNEREMIL